jgi:hypothetical protein
MTDPQRSASGVERYIVIIVGAGASYGATHVLPEPPPLGAGLYDALAAEYPNEWGPDSQLGYWSGKLRTDFESTMYNEIIPQVGSWFLAGWHRPLAQFFAKFALANDRSLYSRLVSSLLQTGHLRRVTFGSLKYDCLLEEAIGKLGLTVDYLLTGLPSFAADAVPVLKIHGSCNFISEDLSPRRPQMMTGSVGVECRIDALPLDRLPAALATAFSTYDQALYPAIGLYAAEKPSIVAPGKLQALRNLLVEKIEHARTLVLIGVRPNPERDSHLWEPIGRSYASAVLYVGGTAEFEALRRLQGRAVHVARTFEDGVDAVLASIQVRSTP